jgi:hypothetical protein
VNQKALRILMNTSGIGAVVDEVVKLARPYGEIEQWRFSRCPTENLIRFFVELNDPTRHPELARLLGGQVTGNEICLEISVAHEPRTRSPVAAKPFSEADREP